MWRIAGDVKWMSRVEMELSEEQRVIFALSLRGPPTEHGDTHLQEESQAEITG